jgi:trimeric autotransporter adhesin
MDLSPRKAAITVAGCLAFTATLAAQTIITIAGGGSDEGRPALASGLVTPSGLAVDNFGNVYVAESYRGRVRKVDAASGTVRTVASGLHLDSHAGLAVDDAGNLYIGDTQNFRVVKVAAGTGVQTTLLTDIIAPGIATDASGIYVADSTGNRVLRIAPGTGQVTTYAGRGEGQGFGGDFGPATSAYFANPTSLALDGSGNLFINDFGNHRIRRVDAATHIITTVAGTGSFDTSGDNGPATAAGLAGAFAVAADADGNLFIADLKDHRIRRVDAVTKVITPVVGNGVAQYSGDGGPATQASLSFPAGAAVDPAGNLYILDPGNHRIRKVDAHSGVITTAVGGVSGEGGPATAAVLNIIGGIAVDSAKNVYVSDASANRVAKVAAGTHIMTTVAGGVGGYSGDGGPAIGAGLNPRGVAADPFGNVYIADSFNKRTRKVDASGAISTIEESRFPIGVAVNASGDVYVTDALEEAVRRIAAATGEITIEARELAIDSSGLAVDTAGNVYIAEPQFHLVQKLAPNGSITTVAGMNSDPGFTGDNGLAVNARLNRPNGVAVDRAGNVYIADTSNDRIRRVDAITGIITTIAGNGSTGLAGDYGPATSAMLNSPSSVAVDDDGVLYIADNGNERIRAVVDGVARRRAIGKR